MQKIASAACSYGSTEIGHIALNGRIASNVLVKLIPVPQYSIEPNIGELWVKSDVSSSGYTDPQKDERDEEGYICTGDIVRLTENRRKVEILDRSKSFLKLSNGRWVSPIEVEHVMLQLPEVLNAFVWADKGAQFVVGVVRVSRDYVVSDDVLQTRLIKHCLDKLAPHQVPRAFLVERNPSWDEVFLTPTGKQSRPKLSAHYGNKVKIGWFVSDSGKKR